MIYQIIFQCIDINDITLRSGYSIVSQYTVKSHLNVKTTYNLVAKPSIVAHVKLNELEALARKIPTLYASFDDDDDDDDDNHTKTEQTKDIHLFACLDFVYLSGPPIDVDGFSNLVYVDIGHDRVYWDAFILSDVEQDQ